MYIDAPRSFPSFSEIDLLFDGFENDKPKIGDPVHNEKNLSPSEMLILEEGCLQYCVNEDMIQLNCNNNSNAWDPRNIRTVTSKSFSVIAQGSDQETTKHRWSTNRPRSLRAKRTDKPPKQTSRTNLIATQTFKPRYNAGNNGSKEEFSKSAICGVSCVVERPHHDILSHEAVQPKMVGSSEGISQNCGTVKSGFQPPATCEVPKCQPTNESEVPSKATSENAYDTLQHMLNEVSCYQRMTDIPESLKEELVTTICRPLIGTQPRKSRSEAQAIVREDGSCRETFTNGDVHTRAEGVRSYERGSERPVDKSTEVPPDIRTDCDSLVPFNTDHVFYHLYGSAYRRAYTYWQVRPPVLPSHLFQYKTTIDGMPFVIGAGTFGEVAVAWFDINGKRQQVAVKEPFSDLVPKDKVFDEAKVTMYLEPTGFVPLCYGLVMDTLGGNFSIVLELFGSGITLRDILSEKTLSRLHWLNISRQLAEGLSRIHGMDILVNDIKPDNILVDLTTPEPVVKFCDMGCASYRSGISFDDANLDIFHHLAPEVKAGGHTSKASDVYGLGKMLDRIVQASVISGIVPVSEKCMLGHVLERATSGEALAMLNSVVAIEMKVVSGPDVEESDSSGFQSSIGYDPDRDLTSGMGTQSDVDDSRPAVFEVSPQKGEDLEPKRSPVSLLLTTLTFDRICMCLFLIISVLFMSFVRVV